MRPSALTHRGQGSTPLQPLQGSRKSCLSIPHLVRRKTLQPRCDQLQEEDADSSHKAAQVLQGCWDHQQSKSMEL